MSLVHGETEVGAAMAEQVDGGSTDRRGRARPRHRNRARYALQEFLLLPLLITGVWLALAAGGIVLDRNAGLWGQAVRQAVAVVVSPQAASMLLSTVTPGLLTVISIIFFVLLMAVQHQSSKYSPVVFDQFLRRKINQSFFGMFIGLTIYCLLILTLVPPGEAIISGTLTLLLSSATFILLLVFVYSTVDQMRPSSTVWLIQEMALRARAGQRPLLARCRAQSQQEGAPSAEVIAERVGYLVHIDGRLLAEALDRTGGAVEVELVVAMGDHVVPGATVAEVRGGSALQRHRLAETVLDALTLGRMRDIDRDAGYAVDQLSSMAWSATAVSGDLEGARVAVETLHSLLADFCGPDIHPPAESFGGPLPLVYNDRVTDRIIDGLTGAIAASGISGQHQTCSDVLIALSRALPRLEPSDQRTLLNRLQRVLPTMTRHVFTVELEDGFDLLRQSMHNADLYNDARRIGQIKEQLHERNRLASPD
ncbi:DUF2254 family protein [Haloactinomyces albus]|uniref:DUF2254 domain-containing protein n=1 Tax=Haloactinomyces albus TaxID=1352928 RepID=A0AAE3Z9R8_9ACTN|nr:DUF2254 family protein [Haloactinomyces albus]MDR7299940.1 hypothetical protein [Haloactinomyces albus]